MAGKDLNKIWKKDDFFLIGGEHIDMDPGVVQLPEDTTLVWQYFFEGVPMGKVDNIRLEDGEILGDIHMFEEDQAEKIEAIKDNIRLGGYYSDVQKVKDENGTRVTSCKLRAVSFVLRSTMPSFLPSSPKKP